ncbi:MAG: FAD-binding oxidoreductase [Sandaracinaceae bacterium]
MRRLDEGALRALREVCRVSTDPSDLEGFGGDWTRVHRPDPGAIAFPTEIEALRDLIARCNALRVPVVPSGGRTGLAGGAVAKDGELVLSLSAMSAIGPIDTVGRTVRVEAGAITEAVHHAAKERGLTWPVDFASKGSSQIGGNLATNAGGVKVIRHGLARQWVLGLEVVTGEGELLTLGGALEKNNTGIDLRQLFIGSEGILGVIGAATLKLARPAGQLDVFLFGVADLAGVLALFAAARGGPFEISAFEMMTDRCMARLGAHRGLAPPLERACPVYVLLEVEAPDRAALDGWLEALLDSEAVLDGTLAANREQAAQLWALREGISESLSATGLPHKNDIALPIAALEGFCSDLEALFEARYPAFEICLFGHIGDGNLHVNVMKPDAMDEPEFLARVHDADEAMFALVRRHGGSVSAEHGIGLLKREWIGYTRSPAELALMKKLKAVFDPNGILNPGKVLPDSAPLP